MKVPIDFNRNFWKWNPQLKYIDPFSQLYNNDNSPDHKASSAVMNCIWIYCDPTYINKIGKLPEEEKRSSILAYLPTFDFDDPLINKCFIKYNEFCLSEAAQRYKQSLKSIANIQSIIDSKMQEGELTLDEFIQVAPNRWQNKKGTAAQVLDLKKKIVLLWQEYEKIARLFEEEQGNIQLYGGGNPTVIEEGGLILNIKDEDEEE